MSWIHENKYDIFEGSLVLMWAFAMIINLGFPNMHWFPAIFIPLSPVAVGFYVLADAKEKAQQ